MMLRRQSQFELFPGAPGASPHKEKSQFSFQAWALTVENMVVVCVVFLMALIIAFAFGVEQGKRLQISQADSVAVPEVSLKSTQPSVVQQVEEPVISAAAVDPVGAAKMVIAKTAEDDFLKNAEKGADAEKSVDKTPSLDTIHTIQVASFQQQERADREAGTLVKKGFDAFVVKKGSYYIVCVGKYNERSQAMRTFKDMRKIYKDCLIRSL